MNKSKLPKFDKMNKTRSRAKPSHKNYGTEARPTPENNSLSHAFHVKASLHNNGYRPINQ